MLLRAAFTLIAATLNVVESLQCVSCRGENGLCDGDYCTSAQNGYCVFQQHLDAYGQVLTTMKTCVTENYIRAGDVLINQVGTCIDTDDPRSGTRYRTYMCNNANLCNSECAESISPQTSTITPSPSHALICYSCNQDEENCFNGSCNAPPNGYCLFQRQQLNVGGVVRYRSLKRCLPAPYVLSPSGSVITTTNQCTQSVDVNGDRYFTLLCNTNNLCNNDCIVPGSSSSTVISTTTRTNSAVAVYNIVTIITAYLLSIINAVHIRIF